MKHKDGGPSGDLLTLESTGREVYTFSSLLSIPITGPLDGIWYGYDGSLCNGDAGHYRRGGDGPWVESWDARELLEIASAMESRWGELRARAVKAVLSGETLVELDPDSIEEGPR